MGVPRFLVCVLGFAGCGCIVLRTSGPLHRTSAPVSAARIVPNQARGQLSLPFTFEPNLGQFGADVRFLARGSGFLAWFTPSGVSVCVRKSLREKPERGVVTLEMEGASGPLQWIGEQRLRGENNYFRGNDPSRWLRHVPLYARVGAPNVMPGVDTVFYGTNEGLEFDLQLAPGVGADDLRLRFRGADRARLDSEGNVIFQVAGSELRMRKPTAYEILSGRRWPVRSEYSLQQDGSIGFRVGPHHAGAVLMIDPSLSVSYSTFLGGAGDDSASSVALDSNGKVYLAGTTTSASSFPESGSKAIGPGGGKDFFVAKIDPTVSGAASLIYLTFLGGSGDESVARLAMDSAGRVAIAGTTSSADYPVTDGSRRTSGSNDLAVSELDLTGAALLFSTLFGGSGAEATQGGLGVALDSSANIYVASDTTSPDLPATTGAFQITYGGGASDAFLAVFHPSANSMLALTYCTYLGINATVGVSGVAVDTATPPNAYLAGFTSNPGTTFPAKNAFQPTYGGDPFDAFLIKLSPLGQGAADLVYATLLGGNGLDQALAVAVDSATPPNSYLTGTTQSTNFPANGTQTAFQGALHPGATANAFLAVVAQNASSRATSLSYSTYLGGSASDAGNAIAVVTANSVYVAGATTSFDFPWHDNLQPLNGNQDAFVAKLDPTMSAAASLLYSTPLGGTAPPGGTALAAANAVATGGTGHVFLAGQTTAADFPLAGMPLNPGFQLTCTSCQQNPPGADAFLTEIVESSATAPSVSFSAANLNFGLFPVGAQNVPPQFAAILNTGDAVLTITALGITGPDGRDFAFASNPSACTGSPIAPGGMCSLEISFIPSHGGAEEGFLNVTSNAPGNPQLLALLGAGEAPYAVPSPASLTFSNQPAGTTSNSHTVRITNQGNQTLTISSVAINGTNPTQFVVQGATCVAGTQVAAGSNCAVNIVFAPATAGSFSAELDVSDDSGTAGCGACATQKIPLNGAAVPPAPIVNLSPMAIGFGSVAVGTTSGMQIATLTNTGSAGLNLTTIAIAGADSANFHLVTQGASPCPTGGGTIAANTSCTVGVNFQPQSSGTKNASLSFNDNAAGSPQMIALAGTGTVPLLQLSASSLTFGLQTVATTSAAQTVTLSNTGDAPLAVNGISITGANPADFNQTSNCPPNVAANGSCVISVTFKPTATGNRSASVTITDNAAGSPHTIPLAGTGGLPAVTLSPAPVNFGSEVVGLTSAAFPVTVTNGGNGILFVSKISFAGANPGDFGETDNCTAAAGVNPGKSCAIQITFTPTASGMRGASLTLADNAPDNPESLPLSGTATDFMLSASGNGGSTSATVTAGQTATYQLAIQPEDGFAATVSLGCTGAPPAGACTTPPSVMVSGNSPAAFTVTVPTTARALLPLGVSPKSAPNQPRVRIWTALFASFAALWCARKARGRGRIRLGVEAAALILFMAILFAACGGGGGGSGAPASGTPAGTYTLTVSGTLAGAGGVTTRNIQLALVVN